jgi:hypothetical protein
MIADTAKVQYEESTQKLWVYNSRLCNIINKILKTYDGGGYYFQAGEEAVFKVPSNQLYAVAAAINSFE